MFRSIVVALDSSSLSDAIMAAVHQLKLEPADQVILTHVISPDESGEQQPADRPSIDPHLGLYRHVEEGLREHQVTLPCQTEIEIVMGDPSEEIIRLASIYEAQLIVIGNRGLKGVSRILQGSVSSQVVSEAPCSVMVVKPMAGAET